jgi:glutamine synthetase
MSRHPEAENLKNSLQAKGVKYAMASYVDIHGVIKGKFVPLSHLGQMLGGSELYTGAALDGVPQDISDNEVAAMPDPASAIQCAWNKDLAWFASDLYLDGKPFAACSRGALKRQTDAAWASRPNSSSTRTAPTAASNRSAYATTWPSPATTRAG